jgi:hypothetical protein
VDKGLGMERILLRQLGVIPSSISNIVVLGVGLKPKISVY